MRRLRGDLVDASMVWAEPGTAGVRLIVIENGKVVVKTDVDADTIPPIPPGHTRPVAGLRETFTLQRFDRLRVLTTELQRLVATDIPVALRLGVASPLTKVHLAAVLWWV